KMGLQRGQNDEVNLSPGATILPDPAFRLSEVIPMLTRRDLLKAAAVGAAASWLPAWKAEEKIRLGVASYSLRNLKRPAAIEAVKACGVTYVNIKSVHLDYKLSP